MEHFEWIVSLSPSSFQDGHQHALGDLSGRRAIAAPHLAIDDSKPQALLSSVVGRIQARIEQEPEPFAEVPAKVAGQPAMGCSFTRSPHQGIQIAEQSHIVLRQVISGEPTGTKFVPQVQRVQQQLQDLAGEIAGVPVGRLQHLLDAVNQVPDTLLVGGMGKATIV